jgi:hypothetical protein
MNLNYNFTDNSKKITYGLMGGGVLLALLGAFTIHEHADQRIWANLLVNGFYFMAIALGATFFIAVQFVAEAGWSSGLKRVPEAIMQYLPVGSLVVLVCLLASQFHLNHLYHWMDPDLYDPNSEHFDEVINGKKAYFNPLFFWGRILAYFIGWTLFMRAFRKRSLQEDLQEDFNKHRKSMDFAAWFLVFFAVTSSTMSWDIIMSIDTHWFSTLFGWYIFAGMFVSAIITINLVIIHLKEKGYFEHVNENHLHDLTKFMFAFSVFWTYLWTAQFLLIWYSDIPEEVTYYMDRWENYKFVWIFNVFINFVCPFLILMTRDAKRRWGTVKVVGWIIIVGHWLDVYIMVMPGTVKEHGSIGLLEIGMLLAFGGLFIHVILSSLAKAPLVAKNHPFLNESKHHHV